MTQASVPESRSYRHSKCGSETAVSGQGFEVASNPLSDMTRTWCTACNSFFPIAEYEWVDTGESIDRYYARHGARASNFERFLCSKKALLMMVGAGLVVGAIAGFILFRNAGMGTKILMMGALGFAGVFAAAAINVSVISKLVVRRVCGVSDTRVLK
jgi:hypothetical protein